MRGCFLPAPVRVLQAEGFDGKTENVYLLCCDFNGVEMLSHCTKKSNKIAVSAKVPCFDELAANGLLESLKGTYGDLLLENPNELYGKGGVKWDVTVAVDLGAPLPGAFLPFGCSAAAEG